MKVSRFNSWRASIRLLIAVSVVSLGGGWLLPDTAGAVTAQPCSASFVGVPGSGQNHSGKMTSAEMSTVAAYAGSAATHAGFPLRNSSILTYPAVDPLHFSAPTVLSHNLTGLDTSETTGQANLTNLINSYRAQAADVGCPNAPILLAGYSQGAEVVSRTIAALPVAVQNTISVALLGDPSFLPGTNGNLDFNNPVYEGIRPSWTPNRWAMPRVVLRRTLDICAASDGVCAYHTSLVPSLADGANAHFHYTTLSYQGQALAAYAGNFLFANKAPASPDTKTGRILISPCLNFRAGPNGSTALIGCIPMNTTVTIVCTAHGNAVTGPYGTETVWDRTTYGGLTGYVSDAWVYTGSNSAVVAAC